MSTIKKLGIPNDHLTGVSDQSIIGNGNIKNTVAPQSVRGIMRWPEVLTFLPYPLCRPPEGNSMWTSASHGPLEPNYTSIEELFALPQTDGPAKATGPPAKPKEVP